jgi:hypothetical protein
MTGVNFGRLTREGFSGYDLRGALEARAMEMRGGKQQVRPSMGKLHVE